MAAPSFAPSLSRVGAQTDILGESPLWDDRAQALVWVDIRRPALRRLDAASGRVDTWTLPALVGSIALIGDGRLLLALGDEVTLFDMGSGRFEPLARLPRRVDGHRFNDGRCDRQGRFFVGTMHNLTRVPEGVLYRLQGRGPLVPVLHGICIPNSLAWSPDGTTMYFADSRSHAIDAYAFDTAGGTPGARRVFATTEPPGINPDEPEKFAAARRAEGHRAFKLKTGFGHALDVRNLTAMREAIGPDDELSCDANQVLDVDQALAFCRDVEALRLAWLEEPIRVDAPAGAWARLAAASTTPLAGGENLQGAQFDAACADDVLRVIQPDVTKWGGITGSIHVARAAVAAGKRYCPHYFGGGVSLLASLHVLAAAGGSGLLEFDCHPNPGREAVVGDLLPVTDGRVPVPTGPGLGAVPDLVALQRYRTWPR